MGSSCCLGIAAQEVLLSSYLGLSQAKSPCRRADNQSIAPLGNEVFLLAIKDCDDLCKVKETAVLKETNCIVWGFFTVEGAKYYTVSILLLLFCKKWETNYVAFFSSCAEHKLK